VRDQLYSLTFSTEKDFTGSDRGEVITAACFHAKTFGMRTFG
jgi:hypothetical protein